MRRTAAAGVATRLLLAAIVCGDVALSATTRARLLPSPARSSRAGDTPVLDHVPGGGPDGGAVSSVAISGAQSSLVFAAFQYGGVFKSTDQGASWVPADRGLPATDACELVAAPRSSTVFAACGDGLFVTTNDGALWRQLDLDNAMPPIVSPSNARVLYQPSFGAVVRSRDGGRRWETVASSRPGGCESGLAIDAADPFVLFCGAAEWVRVSRDGGASWAPLGRKAVSTASIRAVAVDPLNPDAIVAVDDDGRVFRANAATAAWQQIGSAPEPEGLEALQFVGDAGVLFARQGANVLRSLDGGANWQTVFAGSTDVFPFGPSFAVDPRAPSTIFVGTGRGVIVTTDAGGRWTIRDRGITRATTSVALHDSRSPVLYAGNGRELFASADDGATWSVAHVGGAAAEGGVASVESDGSGGVVAQTATASYRLPRDQSAWVVLEPNDPLLVSGRGLGRGATLVKAGDPGFDYSLDGRAWRSARLLGDKLPAAVAVDAADPRLLYAATGGVLGGLLGGNGIWRSSDAGSTWTLVDEPGNGTITRCCRLLADPRAGGIAYAVVAGAGIGGEGDLIRRTSDGGMTWTELPLPGLAYSLTALPTEPTTLLAETFDGANGGRALWASRDNGDTWHRAGMGLPAGIANVAVDPRNPRRLFAATVGRGVYRSADAGASWQRTGRAR